MKLVRWTPRQRGCDRHSVWWVVFLFALIAFTLLAASSRAQDYRVPPIERANESDHFVFLLDQSGSFQRVVSEGQLTEIIRGPLRSFLIDSLGFNDSLDCTSMMFFGISEDNPRIDNGLIHPIWTYSNQHDPKDISLHDMGYRQTWRGLTVLTATFPLALYTLGAQYRSAGLDLEFSHTYLIRISDELENTGGNQLTLLKILQNGHHDHAKFAPNVGGFPQVYRMIDSVNQSVDYGHPDLSHLICFSKEGRISCDPTDYFEGDVAYPVKCYITEARPRYTPDFSALFSSEVNGELEYRSHRPAQAGATISLREYGDVAAGLVSPVSYVTSYAYQTALDRDTVVLSPEKSLEPGAVRLSITATDSLYPISMSFWGFFTISNPYLGRQFFHVVKTVSVFESNPPGSLDRELMGLPFVLSELTADEVRWQLGAMALLIALVLVYLILFRPLRSHLTFEPLDPILDGQSRYSIDLNDADKLPIIIGHVDRHDKNYRRPHIPSGARIDEFGFLPSDEGLFEYLLIGNGEHQTENRSAVTGLFNLAVPEPLAKHNFKSQESMGLVLQPAAIKDLTSRGRRELVGMKEIGADFSVEIPIKGRFAWKQLPRRHDRSQREIDFVLRLKPHAARAAFAYRSIGQVEYEWKQEIQIAEMVFENLIPDRAFVRELDVTIYAVLTPLVGAPPPPRLDFSVTIDDGEGLQKEVPASKAGDTEVDSGNGGDGGGRVNEEFAGLRLDRPKEEEITEGRSKRSSQGSSAKVRIRGQLPSRGQVVRVTALFNTLKHIRHSWEYELAIYVISGREQLELRGNGVQVEAQRPVRVCVLPGSDRAAARFICDLQQNGSGQDFIDLLSLATEDTVDLTGILPYHLTAQRSVENFWTSKQSLEFSLSNSGKRGGGSVNFEIQFSRATITFSEGNIEIDRGADPRSLVEITGQLLSRDNAESWGPRKRKLEGMKDQELDFPSATGEKEYRMQIEFHPDDRIMRFKPDTFSETMELTFRVNYEVTNPILSTDQQIEADRLPIDSDAEATLEAVEMESKRGSLGITVPIQIKREPPRGLLALDLGTSAIAVAYQDDNLIPSGNKENGSGEGVLLDLRSFVRSKGLPVIDNEGDKKSPFLSGPLAYFPDQIREDFSVNLVSDEHAKIVCTEAGVVFPATNYFINTDLLVPYLKMLVAMGVSEYRFRIPESLKGGALAGEVTSEAIKWLPPVRVSTLLAGALEILIKRLCPSQLQAHSRRRGRELMDGIRRIVITLPNNARKYQTDLMRNALPQGEGFRFAEDYILFMSESDAAAYFYLYHKEDRETLESFGESFHLLVYDCGAGTLDLSLRKVECRGGHIRSNLVQMLSVEGAGNALDEGLATVAHNHLRELGESQKTREELQQEFGFQLRFLPLADRARLPQSVPEDAWREYLWGFKRNLYHTKHKLSELHKKGSLKNSTVVNIPFHVAQFSCFSLRPGNLLEPEQLKRLESMGLTYSPDYKKPKYANAQTEFYRVSVPYREVEETLEEKGFYEDHVDQPLDIILADEDGSRVVPAVVLVTGRTSLFPGLQGRLREWFQKVEQGGNTQIRIFADEPELMKSIVVRGALSWADKRAQRDFDVPELYGYYVLLYRSGVEWRWIDICSHHKLGEYRQQRRRRLACGQFRVEETEEAHYVFCHVRVERLLDRFKKSGSRSLKGPGFLEIYKDYVIRLGTLDMAGLRHAAESAGVTDAMVFGQLVETEGAHVVDVTVQVGGERFGPKATEVQVEVGAFGRWPMNLWTERV